MSKVEDFLSAADEEEIVQAILQAEKNTSGEIRVHIESHTQLDHYERAKEIFHILKMDNTKEGNGVLLYVAVNDRKFSICGDKGIDEVVPESFWESTKELIQTHFKAGNFKEGILQGVRKAGTELEKHFPWLHGDTNELSNEISKG